MNIIDSITSFFGNLLPCENAVQADPTLLTPDQVKRIMKLGRIPEDIASQRETIRKIDLRNVTLSKKNIKIFS